MGLDDIVDDQKEEDVQETAEEIGLEDREDVEKLDGRLDDMMSMVLSLDKDVDDIDETLKSISSRLSEIENRISDIENGMGMDEDEEDGLGW